MKKNYNDINVSKFFFSKINFFMFDLTNLNFVWSVNGSIDGIPDK